MSNYRPNVADHLVDYLKPIAPLRNLLDFGAGNGWMLQQILDTELSIQTVSAVEVQARPETEIEITMYDGDRLPFDDRSFEVTMAVDVLHHCPDPRRALEDIARVSDRYILVKDHTYSSPVGFAVLSILDELGNRKFGIPNRYRYQRAFTWDAVLDEHGFEVARRTTPLPCHDGPLSFTDRYQVISLYERRTP